MKKIRLPKDLWFLIFRDLSAKDRNAVGSTSRYHRRVYKQFLFQQVTLNGLAHGHFIRTAEAAGITINATLLLRLARNAPEYFKFHILPKNLEEIEPKSCWPLAALFGNIDWLREHLGGELKTITDSDGFSVLFYLALGGHKEIIDKYFSDAEITDKIFMAAADGGHFELTDQWEGKAQYKYLIHCYALYGDVERFNKLYEANPELIQSRDVRRKRPIDFAVRGGRREMIDRILALARKQHSPDAKTFENSPLRVAAEFGHADLVRDFLNPPYNNDVVPNGVNCQYSTLHLSIMGGSWECYELLLPRFKKPFEKTLDGSTPFYLALKKAPIDFIRKYLDHHKEEEAFKSEKPLSHAATLCFNYSKFNQLYSLIPFDWNALNSKDQTPLLNLACIAKKVNNHSTWMYLALLLEKYHKKLDSDYLDKSDKSGDSIRSIISDANQDDLFKDVLNQFPLPKLGF